MTQINTPDQRDARLKHLRAQVVFFFPNDRRPHVQWTTMDGCPVNIPLTHAAWSIYHGRDLTPNEIVISRDGDDYYIEPDNLELLAKMVPYARDGYNYVQIPDAATGGIKEMRHDRLRWSHLNHRLLSDQDTVEHLDGDTLNDNAYNLRARHPDGSLVKAGAAPAGEGKA